MVGAGSSCLQKGVVGALVLVEGRGGEGGVFVKEFYDRNMTLLFVYCLCSQRRPGGLF